MRRFYFLILFLSFLFSSCSRTQSPQKQRLENLLGKMTLKQKIGQMFIVGVEGHQITQQLKRAIAKDYLGGFYLAPDSNFKSVQDAARLINIFQKVALASTEIPLFISTRQEGGLIQALNHTNGAIDTPGNFALGFNGGFEDTYSIYRIMARELRATGFNLALAPIINTAPANPEVSSQLRLFSSNPDLVTKLAQAAVRGFQQNGIIAAAGYFPDFPSSDTTTTIPLKSKNVFAEFKAVVSEETSAIISSIPAVFSKNLLTDKLRKNLGFNYLVISDDLSQSQLQEDFVVKAVQAGVDIIFQQTPDLDRIRRQIEILTNAVQSGQISKKRINASVERILRLKSAYRLFENSIVDLTKIEKQVGAPESFQEALEITRRCITIPKDSLKLLPLEKSAYQKILLVTPDSLQSAVFWQSTCYPGKNLYEMMRKEISEIENLKLSAAVTDSVLEIAIEMAQEADLVIFLALTPETETISQIVNVIDSLNKPIINFSVVPPEKFIPHISTYLVLSGVRRISLQASVDVLFGRHFQTDQLTHANY